MLLSEFVSGLEVNHCGKEQAVTEDIFGNRGEVEFTCPACQKPFRVVNPRTSTLRVDTTHRKVHTITEDVSPDGYALRLPADQNLSLIALEGAEQGTVYPVNKPRITIGRTNVDVTIDDQMTSRVHCALEISDEGVTLRGRWQHERYVGEQ